MPFLAPPPFLQEALRTPYVAEASNEGAAAMLAMEAPEGFAIGLFAAEPLLANPVAFHVDHAGDVYVCESFRVHAGVTDMRDHMGWLADELDNLTVEDRVAMYRRQEGEAGFAQYSAEEERVRLLRDQDRDGVADAASVFADGFHDPADGIGAGVLSYRGDVFYTCIPHLWRLCDRDGDGAAEERTALSSGYGVHVALLGHDMHGLILGPDGRLYWSIGDRGLHVEQEGRVFDLPHAGAVLRCELDGSGLEVVHTGLRNPQELAFDDRGDLFTGDNNSDGGDQARWVQIVQGADSGWRFFYQYVTEPVMRGPWNDELLWKPHYAGQPAYILPPIANLADGPSGLAHDPGTGLPERWRGHFFLCDFRGDAQFSGVHAFTNIERGAGFELGVVEHFVWKTLATDCQIGPDGAFYVLDWVHGWNKTGKGRIYRLTSAALDDPLVRETADLLRAGVAKLAPAELEELLSHPDQRVRQEAHLELAWRGAVEPLARAARAGAGLARLHGIWGLGVAARRRQHADIDAVLLGLLPDPEPEVRAQAAKVLGDLRVAAAGPPLTERLKDGSARVRFQAALALGRIRAPEACAALLELARETGDADPVLRHACVMGLGGCLPEPSGEMDLRILQDLGLLDPPAPGAQAGEGRLPASADPRERHARMALLLAARRARDPGVAVYFGDPEPLLVREAAIAIHDEPLDAALPALAHLLARTAEQGFTGSPLVRRVLNANLRLGGEERARALARYSLRPDQEEAHRAEALAMLAEWSDPSDVDRVLGSWRPLPPRDAAYVPGLVRELAPEMAAQPDAVRNAWIALAGAVRADVAPALEAFLRDRAQPTSTRTAALTALAELGTPRLRLAVAEALSDPDGRVRAAALDALGRLDLAQALPLVARVLDDGELAERRAAYRLLASAPGAEADLLLARELQKLAADLLPAELALDVVQAAEAQGGKEAGAWLEVHRAPRAADPELAPWLDSLFGGDPERGRRLFREEVSLSCLRCHRTEPGAGPSVGPALEGVGSRLSRLQLLESVAAPNRHVAAGFATETFFLKDGGVLAGRLLEERADGLVVLDSAGAVIDVAPEDVEERRPGLSAMPNDLLAPLSRAELRDLIAYLASL